MEDRFGTATIVQLTDRSIPAANVIDATVLDRAIEDASSFIDGNLQGRYALPLSAVPSLIERLAVDLTRYYLHDDHAPEFVITKYKDAEKTLRMIAKGDINLGIDALGAKPAESSDVTIESGGSVFGREDSGFI